MSKLRISLGSNGDRVVACRPGYVLRLQGGELDADRFERLVGTAGRFLDSDELEAALTSLDEALGLWPGRPYADFAEEDWARAEVSRLEELRTRASSDVVH